MNQGLVDYVSINSPPLRVTLTIYIKGLNTSWFFHLKKILKLFQKNEFYVSAAMLVCAAETKYCKDYCTFQTQNTLPFFKQIRNDWLGFNALHNQIACDMSFA